MEDELSDAARARLAQLAAMLKGRHAHLLSFDHAAAVEESERLAHCLERELGAAELRGFRFLPVPRGGLIVLGYLAYQLGLRTEQLQPGAMPGSPVVVIDDCAYTGRRLARFLGGVEAGTVLVGHLCSPPELRRALLAAEPRVRACLAARDLVDLPGAPEAAADGAWRARWSELLGGEGYWLGKVQPVFFPWSEPDMPFFNRATGRVEQGWHFAAPDRCLKVRSELDPRARWRRSGEYRAPAGLVHGHFDGVLWLCRTATEEVVSLQGIGSALWSLLAAGVPEDDALRELAATYEAPEAELRGDLVAFTTDLLARGLLEEIEPRG